MRKYTTFFFYSMFLLAIAGGLFVLSITKEISQTSPIEMSSPSPKDSSEESRIIPEKITNDTENTNQNIPLLHANERITKKPFGIYISPETSPVQPERFSGYHTGVDYEILYGEETSNISVFAICDGEILEKRFVSGYGGVFVQSCFLKNEQVTVLYGHLDIFTSNKTVGNDIRGGDFIALLGKENSSETDDERKHLHLSIHRGTSIDYRGYVTNKSELSQWINPEEVLQSTK